MRIKLQCSATVAPKEAAGEIPTVKGLTSGLRIMPCMTTPAIANAAPATKPSATRGRRR